MAGDERIRSGSASDGYAPLFETKQQPTKGRLINRVFAATVFASICMVWIYRLVSLIFTTDEVYYSYSWWSLFGMLCAELWFGFYWILSQALRWNPVYRYTFKNRLSQRYEYEADELPRVDIFVCTADPTIEPPIMVMNTVLSVMAYNYPPSKLSVYLSDDGGSELTFYALLEASNFSKSWLPFCRKYRVQPRSPVAYFKSSATLPKPNNTTHDDDHHRTINNHANDLKLIKNLYKEMEARINKMMELGRVSEEARQQHKGFSLWNSTSSKQDHDTILQILFDGRNDLEAIDEQGSRLPTLVYLAREKRPQHFHNYKAGAMNALIRVSSAISNAPIILNVDCDMYSNNVDSVRDAVCFFMDEKQSKDIAFVQFPQKFDNITKNDIYGSSMEVIYKVEAAGLDGNGGICYIGSGCFHRRDVLGTGRKLLNSNSTTTIEASTDWINSTILLQNNQTSISSTTSVTELEQKAIPLASSTYELNTKWGKEMGLIYGCSVEDILTGLTIHSKGWKSVYYNPDVAGFLGLGPTTLLQTLIQHKRWSEGQLQISLSKNCPLLLGRNSRIPFGLQLGYLYFSLWAANCFAVLAYSTIPCLFLIKGIPLFPEVSSPWFVPFAYVAIASYGVSLLEFLRCGGTILGWWNEQRIWLYKRTSSYLFATADCIGKLLGLSNLKFSITSKVPADDDVEDRYAREIIEFGANCASPMFTILATLALLNLFCLAILTITAASGWLAGEEEMIDPLGLQIILCVAFVAINLPLYEALFLRKDKGKMPTSVALISSALAIAICVCFN